MRQYVIPGLVLCSSSEIPDVWYRNIVLEWAIQKFSDIFPQ